MKQIVLAKDLHQMFVSAMNFLSRSDISIQTATTAEELLMAHFEKHAALIVTKLDLPGMSCETMVNIIRRSDALRTVSIMVFFEDNTVQRERSAGCGANVVMALPADPEALALQVSQLLNVVPRLAYRVVLNMAVEGIHNGKPILCNTENISANGMLIRTTEALMPGGRIACSLYLPDGTRVSAEGDVVRVVGPGAGPATNHNRYGIRFLNIPADTASAITAFVNKQLQLKQPPDHRLDSLVA